ncbi:phosphoenolpyruvate carboxykinase [Gordoniibacillus kamchatkensis]|uniref:Phosphoenolpyruvate carboxykinase (ATP) n=1 Tax=Gordoniibacillus kamchatkensis TaxID=1590651 RepID=A0ABR5AK16_9BACL|nr:phosphoenolpyruvate carboxykinase (ATP) [Paenibacillus sp. VKM B-2647]KIL41359.1 phosphoenolpyruvate carboxykinase [Paenibacillus sp. VKM B-2647]
MKVQGQLSNTIITHENLPAARLLELALKRSEGVLTREGALRVLTGAYTGRSPKDKYIVTEPSVEKDIAWGSVNQPMSQQQFERLYQKALRYMEQRELFVFDGFAGADEAHRLPIRVVTEYAWHNLFVRQLFIRPSEQELKTHRAEFTVIALPGLKADPAADGTRSETFICLSLERKIVLIGGTEYAGEMKKSIFTVLNYTLPQQGVLPMHCSANVGEKGDVALFFGLSGTGKTTLSADPNRRLIGDDEHGWSERGVFNFEGGCYAKCAGLSEAKEPQIWKAIREGAVLENVALDPETGIADYDDTSITENTRAAYPIEHIPNALVPGVSGHPNVIIFLTADAFGVLPPIAKLTKEQAIYHFLSGYTSKLAGTERGVTEPEATFSTCFGSPFLPLHPTVYADMLADKIDKHQTRIYLINTGWSGGPYGVGERIRLSYTRAMVAAALDGTIEQAEFAPDPIFGVFCPDRVQGVPSEVLRPRDTWADQSEYEHQARELASRFIRNFAKFGDAGAKLIQAGPRL